MHLISPVPDETFACPRCDQEMLVEGFWLPGMHVCAKTVCQKCGGRFFSHLRVHFVGGPVHFDRETLALVSTDAGWFDHSIRNGAQRVIDRDPVIRIEQIRPLKRPVIVSLVDYLYGHCFHRLYKTAELLDADPPADILIVAPRFMEWLIPDGVAEIWIVDIKPSEALAMFPALASRYQARLFDLPPAHVAGMWAPGVFDMTRFTRVPPISGRTEGVFERPVLTFSWRDDRFWTWRGREISGPAAGEEQAALFVELCEALRVEMPGLDVAVTGYGLIGRFPDWIADMRATERTDVIERGWVERYARSHATMGVYGSNMLLPMARSAGCVQLVTTTYIHALNHAVEYIDRRFTASQALGQIFSIPTSCSLSDIATVTMTAIQRGTRSLSYGAARRPTADWIWKRTHDFRLRDAEGNLR